MKTTVNRELVVDGLSSYIEAIQEIAQRKDGINMLWYRGHSNITHTLLPSLYRDNRKVFGTTNNKLKYTSVHLSEDMRMQHYHARNYQFINNDNLNSIEWLGLAQHHHLKTRLLDWSTSSIHALVFAVEKQIKNNKPEKGTPCVWVLEPQELNKRVVKSLIAEKNINSFMDTFNKNISINSLNELQKFFEFLNNDTKFKNIYLESNDSNDKHLNYIYNLSYFDELLKYARNQGLEVFMQTAINPIYLLLAKYYIEGYRIDENSELSPLAIIHPQQCERIRAQQGVFTIFPFPDASHGEDSIKNMSLEILKNAEGILHKIIIEDPYRVAAELRVMGITNSWLYPEAPIINGEIENNPL